MTPRLVCQECGLLPEHCPCPSSVRVATPLVPPKQREAHVRLVNERMRAAIAAQAGRVS